MAGNITLTAPGGRPGDVWLDLRNPARSPYEFVGRVVATDGSPRIGATVRVLERRSLVDDVLVASGTTDARGGYSIRFSLPGSVSGDLLVHASDGVDSVVSPLLAGLRVGSYAFDLILGTGEYVGRTEWDRIVADVTPLLGGLAVVDIPADRIDWLARRADAHPLHLAMWVQAHRLADRRTVAATSCFAFLRAGLPADLLELLRAGEAAWSRALRSAWLAQIIPLPGDGSAAARDTEVATQIVAMREILVAVAVATPASGVNPRLIYDTAGLSEAQQRTFAELWLAHDGSLSSFWSAVEASSLAAQVPVFKFTIQAATLLGGHVSTIAALQAERTASTITALADTAAWGIDDWDTMLVSRAVTVPDAIPGTGTAKRQKYARTLFNIVEDAHPSRSLRHALTRDELASNAAPHTQFVATFLANNPDFDVVEGRLGVHLADASSPWTGIDPADQAQARANLELVQRVYRVTPRIGRYITTKALLDAGITSAAGIVARTKQEFVAELGPLFDGVDHHSSELAAAVWDNAAKVHAATVALGSQLALVQSKADPQPLAGLEGPPLTGHGLEDLASVLGNLDYCACKHCRSVFSPAAYLADLLKFIDDRGALTTLHARRPDLEHILLDCTNTNVELPYIDLVNELLESYVLTGGELPASSHQTTWMASELRLHPEHLDAAAYDAPPPEPYDLNLTTLVHPWTLPFSLPTIESRTYLAHLGVPRHEVMRRYLHIIPAELDEDAIAADVLGLSATEFSIVRGAYVTAFEDGREFWGYAAGPNHWVSILNGTHENGDVGQLLVRGGFSLDELRELLSLDFINPEGSIALQFGESCALADATIAFLDAPALDRIHRFTRLQHATRIPARMLNVLLRDALGGTLDRTALRALADVVRLRERLRLDWDELAAFWSTVLDAREYETGSRALHQRRFLAKELGSAPDFVSSGTTLVGQATPPVTMTDAQRVRVLAGIGASESELAALAGSSLASGVFSFANLTALSRCMDFARALGLSIHDLVLLAGTTGTSGLIGENPFASPAATLRFIELVDGIRAAGFGIAELDWLLRHEFDVDPIDVDEVGRTLAELSRGLTTIETETSRLAEADLGKLESELSKLLAEPHLSFALAIVDKTTVESEAAQNAFIDAHFAVFVDAAAAKAALVGTAKLADPEQRIAWMFGKVVGHLRRRALLHDTIAAKLGIPASVAEALVSDVLHDPSSDAPLFEVFRMPFASEAEIAAGSSPATLTPATHQNEFAAWTRITKAARLCARFELRADEVVFFSGGDPEWLDFDALPLDTEDDDASFAAWDALRRVLELRSLSKPGTIVLAELADAADFTSAVAVLADHTGWDVDALDAMATALGYSEVVQFASGQAVIRLRRIVETAARFGVPLAEGLAWASATPTTAHATAIKLAARAKHAPSRWPDIAKPLRDLVRERMRDALVDAAIAITPTFSTSNDVFEHLLIDVEMGTCMMTTRVLQAITAVQIFVHRVLLHLESVTFGSEAVARWEWMKNYRVWEANRKVFLYPENWIEPELRSDKTAEFEALEALLMQGTLEPARVEKALESYLERMDRVSSLEIIGVHESDDVLWLLGRTHAAPHEWFLRRRDRSGTWSSWEELPLEISGDAVAMVVVDARLHLFWVMTQDAQHHLRPTVYADYYFNVNGVKTKVKPDEDAEDAGIYIEIGEFERGDRIAGVTFQVVHAERTPSGEWSKPTLSQTSNVLVKMATETKLHLFVGEREVHVVVMQEWLSNQSGLYVDIPDDEPEAIRYLMLRALFVHRLVESETYYAASTFEDDDHIASTSVFLSKIDLQLHEDKPIWAENYDIASFTIHYLRENTRVAMLGSYRLQGQRYVHRDASLGAGGATDEGFLDHGITVWAPHGLDQSALLFGQPSHQGLPALVHPASIWTPWAGARWTPFVYDDRKRKYLIERKPVTKSLEPDADEPSPGGFGTYELDVAPYVDCNEIDELPWISIQRSKPARQMSRDRLRRAPGWPQPKNPAKVLQWAISDVVAVQAQAVVNANAGIDDIQNPLPIDNDAVAFTLEPLYHPFSKTMLEALATSGLAGLYAPPATDDLFRQELEHDPFVSDDLDLVASIVASPPIEEFDFRHDSAYGRYNWELFYHVPMLIANKLAAEQRWDDAQRWYHRMFNPIDLVDEPDASRFWRIKPFVAEAGALAKHQFEIMAGIGATKAEQAKAIAEFGKQVAAWQANPFDPHAVARIRPGVYQRALLRKYFDNLLAWADHLFRRDTFESVSEATVLYVLLGQLLGPRPHEVPGPDAAAEPKTFAELAAAGLDAFSNALIALESWIHLPPAAVEKQGCDPKAPDLPWVRVPVVSHFWYFCYPPNPELLKYWDILDDRLFKIRHCQTIEGVARRLPLFEPPIDPALLVQAKAAGVDLRSVLAELDSGLPPYRFRSVHGRALAFTGTLAALGNALLGALERRDGEALARLRSEQELELLAYVAEVRRDQITEARHALTSLESARALAEDRKRHYQQLIGEDPANGKVLNSNEKQHFNLASRAARMRRAAGATQIVAGVLSALPQWSVGTNGFSFEFGGLQLTNVANATASVFSFAAAEHDYHANKAQLTASFERRAEDWRLQLSQADKELTRIDKDILAARIRVQIAERELDNHDLQVAQAREADTFLRSKFTNQQLYDWMIGQLSTIHFQTYQLAFDLAKRAERAYRHELAIADGAPIIKYGYWDSLRKGLLAGDKLRHDLERLDLAYMDRDIREFELRKTISLSDLDADALHQLRETGACSFEIPEVLYDLDHPGHHVRRIRAVRLTIPAVVGPFTSLGARLQIEEHRTRTSPTATSSEDYLEGDNDDRFHYGTGAAQSIATSTAMADGGLFNLDFRDERYLPFEYCGAISRWTLSLPDLVRQFDYRTIANVILHVDYTARDGGSNLRTHAQGAILDQFNALTEGATFGQWIAVHQAFPNDWAKFLSVPASGTTQTLDIPLTPDHFPYFARRRGFVVRSVALRLLSSTALASEAALDLGFDTPSTTLATIALTRSADTDACLDGTSASLGSGIAPATYQLTHTQLEGSALAAAGPLVDEDGWLTPSGVAGLMLVVQYTLEA